MTQIVNYPLLYKVKSDIFSEYHDSYVSKISIIVVPMMILDFVISLLLFVLTKTYLVTISLFIVVLIFLTTFFIQVPIHDKLKFSANHKLIKKLINTNRIRTFLWFIKCIISFNLLLKETI